MKILAIDPGTKTGWAFMGIEIIDKGKNKGYRTESGVQDFSLKRGESTGMRFVLFRKWFIDFLNNMKPELVIYEQAHHRGGFATNLLVGMTTRIEEICAIMKIEHTSIHSAILKKFAAGSGRASKERILELARARWGEVIDDNQADALFMATWAKQEFEK